jgi:hypothetical protein
MRESRLTDWRGETLARVRILIKQADPEVVEEWKWPGVQALKARRRGTEHVGASYRSPRPLSEETKVRLRSVVKPISIRERKMA